MASSRAIVGIASRMYEAQEALRGLWGAEYDTKIQPMRDLVQRKAAQLQCSEIEACMEVVKRVIDTHPHAAMAALAATVDLIERPRPAAPEDRP